MKKITATAALTTICSLSIATSIVAPAFAQPSGTTTTPAGTTTTPAATPSKKTAPAATPSTQTAPAGSGSSNPNSNTPSIVEELKLSQDQQTKLAKLNQTVMQKKIGILTTDQKKEVQQAMQQGKTPTLTLTTAQQAQLKAIQASALKQQDEILTKEQREKLKAYNKQYNGQPQ